MSTRSMVAALLLCACASGAPPAPAPVAKPGTAAAAGRRFGYRLAKRAATVARPAATLDVVCGRVVSDADGTAHIEVRVIDADGNQIGASQFFAVLPDLRVVAGDALFDASTEQASNVVLDKAPSAWGAGAIRAQADAVVKALVDAGKVK